MREHDGTALTAAELEAARRELAASLALARPGSPIGAPIQARMAAIDAELTGRAAAGPGNPAPRAPALRPAATRVEKDAPAPSVPGRPGARAGGRAGIPGPLSPAAWSDDLVFRL